VFRFPAELAGRGFNVVEVGGGQVGLRALVSSNSQRNQNHTYHNTPFLSGKIILQKCYKTMTPNEETCQEKSNQNQKIKPWGTGGAAAGGGKV
jgi:hypothetical protein